MQAFINTNSFFVIFILTHMVTMWHGLLRQYEGRMFLQLGVNGQQRAKESGNSAGDKPQKFFYKYHTTRCNLFTPVLHQLLQNALQIDFAKIRQFSCKTL